MSIGITIIGMTLVVLLLVFRLWHYGRCYPRHSVNPADYPWLERARTQTPEQMADELLARMSLPEKLAQLSGDGGHPVLLRLAINVYLYHQFPNMYAGYNARLRIPPLSFTDGPRGIVIGHATGFPVAMARGATWDTDLERRVGDALGREARAVGANYFGGICVNLLRHPGWGRAQETYGEDPLHVGLMAVATVEGVQHHNVMACIKHFALNSIENSRFYVDVDVDDRSLHEVFLPQFKRCIDAGAASLMSAYNRVRGDYCAHQRWLLEGILREQWGFRGFVTSDWVWGVYDGVKGIEAGLDVEMPRAHAYGAALKKAVRQGVVAEARIDTLVRRTLATRLRFASRPDPETYHRGQLACEAHVALAQEVAEKSMVLLQNRQDCLPLAGVRTLAVIGELAVEQNTGDHGSSRTSPPQVITLLDGMREWLGEGNVLFADGRDLTRAVQLAARADAVLIVVGCKPEDEGENLVSNHQPGPEPKVHKGGDRMSLDLAEAQVQMIRAVAAVQPRSVVTLIGGSAMLTSSWCDAVAAIVMAWYPGMMGGRALARLLSGDLDFSGRLPFAWPAANNRLPAFDAFASSAGYGYYHGYTWFDETRQQPAYPMGFGLGYTGFSFSELQLCAAGDAVAVSVTVTNTGQWAGRTVVQCYAGPLSSPVTRHRKRLQAFAVVKLAAGESCIVSLTVPQSQLARYCPEQQQWQFDVGEYCFWVGASSDERACLSAGVSLPAVVID